MRSWPASLAVLSVLLLAPSLPAQTPVPIGRVTAVEGVARVTRQGAAQGVALAAQSPLYRSDTIQTAAARLRLVLNDETTVALGELTTVTLARIAEGRSGQPPVSRLSVSAGVLRVVAQVAPPWAELELRTPAAIAAVRGTEYLADVKPATSAFVVLRGTVAVSNARSDVRGAVLLGERQGTDVSADQPPTRPVIWGEARPSALQRATSLP